LLLPASEAVSRLVAVLIAGVGDVHGRWAEACALVNAACAKAGVETDRLDGIVQVGDAEPQRTEEEADQVPGPAKYRKLGDFAAVGDGTVVFPAPVWFIAGNHEPFGALDADGGLAAGRGGWGPGVTYLGRAGMAAIGELKVAFLSGIHGSRTFRESGGGRRRPSAGKRAGHYTPDELEKARGALASGSHVLVTHDWPAGLAETGRFGATGDENVRALIDEYQPLLSLHGHMHRPASAVLGKTQVECLAIVGYRSGDPLAAVGIWDLDLERPAVTRLA
jgi:hypothetical protein